MTTSIGSASRQRLVSRGRACRPRRRGVALQDLTPHSLNDRGAPPVGGGRSRATLVCAFAVPALSFLAMAAAGCGHQSHAVVDSSVGRFLVTATGRVGNLRIGESTR